MPKHARFRFAPGETERLIQEILEQSRRPLLPDEAARANAKLLEHGQASFGLGDGCTCSLEEDESPRFLLAVSGSEYTELLQQKLKALLLGLPKEWKITGVPPLPKSDEVDRLRAMAHVVRQISENVDAPPLSISRCIELPPDVSLKTLCKTMEAACEKVRGRSMPR